MTGGGKWDFFKINDLILLQGILMCRMGQGQNDATSHKENNLILINKINNKESTIVSQSFGMY